MIKAYVKKVIHKLILAERSPSKLALSFCVGNFIACSPTIPIQTPLAFVLSWIFKLNTTVVVTTLYLVNNPLTMIPIYIIGYVCGMVLFEKILGISLVCYNPVWIEKFNHFLSRYINISNYIGGAQFCIWYLLVGGILFSLILSIALYPIVKRLFYYLIAQQEHKQNH